MIEVILEVEAEEDEVSIAQTTLGKKLVLHKIIKKINLIQNTKLLN